MIIDQEDLQPRPADDYLAQLPPRVLSPTSAHVPRAVSIILGRSKRETQCHQLGVPFSELPHTQLP